MHINIITVSWGVLRWRVRLHLVSELITINLIRLLESVFFGTR
jgi:hypothetical protein